MTIVFYSWQSDLPNKFNRGLIQDALEGAAKDIRADDTLAVEPVIDRDTANVAGSPDIGTTILSKIAGAAVLVCDVSIINDGQGSRPTPNPNVMFELGYGIHALSDNRVILVMNEAYGGVEQLPFDLRMKRVITYKADDNCNKAQVRKELRRALGRGLRLILEKQEAPGGPPPAGPVDVAIDGLDSQARDVEARMRDMMQDFLDRLGVLSTDIGPGQDEELITALEASLEIVTDFAKVSDRAARMDAKAAVMAVFRGFENLLASYQDRSGHYYETDSDLQKFVGHEMFVVLVAALLRHDRWGLLSELLEENLCFRSSSGSNICSYAGVSDYVKTLESRNERLGLHRVSLRADLLKERHVKGELADLSPWEEFMNADYLLYLRSELRPEHSPFDAFGIDWWRPWSVLYLNHSTPRIIERAEMYSFVVKKLLPVLGLDSVELFRARYGERSRRINGFYRRSRSIFQIGTIDANKLGSQ